MDGDNLIVFFLAWPLSKNEASQVVEVRVRFLRSKQASLRELTDVFFRVRIIKRNYTILDGGFSPFEKH